jgi:hypothetical protein
VYLSFARDWAIAIFKSEEGPSLLRKYLELSIDAIQSFFDAQINKSTKDTTESFRGSDKVMEWVEDAVLRLRNNKQAEFARAKIIEDLLTNDDLPIPCNNFISLYGALAPKRFFFMTKNNLMGMGESTIRGGDLVTIFPGCKAPMIIRRIISSVATKYHVVGHCYLHRMMNGEAITNIREYGDSDNIVETFVLQ